jgi:acyl dehydratase
MSSKAEQGHAILSGYVGKDEGTGEWFTVDQARVNLFADATLDHQFIHIDPEKAAKLSPYKVTIAHGFLTLSLVVHLGRSVPPVAPEAYQGVLMGVNYGLDKVRFPSPVKVGSRVRACRGLIAADLVAPNTVQLKQRITVEIEGEPKPGCVAETLTRLIYA